MTATVHIERPELDPYRVVLIRKEGDRETVIAELRPGTSLTHQHVWRGSDLIIREVE